MSEEAIKRVNRAGKNYYAILGVEKNATDDELKKAYRKLALQLHPDKCHAPGAEEAFKRVGEAFGALSDPKKRDIYDQCGADGLQSHGGGGGGGGVSPEDIFEAFFSGGGLPGGGGARFHMGGGGGQTFRFGSAGPGGTFQFTTMGGPGSFGGLHQRRGAAPSRRTAEEREVPPEPQVPEWAKTLQTVASLLGPLLPVVVLMAMFIGMMLLGTMMQIFMSKAIYIMPILYLAEGRLKWTLVTGIFALSLVGII